MEDNKHFTISYYAKKHKKHISRQAKWDSLCRYWTSKQGNSLITYFDIDANNYRTCSGNYKIRFQLTWVYIQYIIPYIINNRKDTMQYLIIREIEYQNLDNSFDVMNQTTDINKANDMLQGYTLINKDKDTTYSIVKYETPLVLTQEVA